MTHTKCNVLFFGRRHPLISVPQPTSTPFTSTHSHPSAILPHFFNPFPRPPPTPCVDVLNGLHPNRRTDPRIEMNL